MLPRGTQHWAREWNCRLAAHLLPRNEIILSMTLPVWRTEGRKEEPIYHQMNDAAEQGRIYPHSESHTSDVVHSENTQCRRLHFVKNGGTKPGMPTRRNSLSSHPKTRTHGGRRTSFGSDAKWGAPADNVPKWIAEMRGGKILRIVEMMDNGRRRIGVCTVWNNPRRPACKRCCCQVVRRTIQW